MRKQRALAALLALVMVVGLLPAAALAAKTGAAAAGPGSIAGTHYSSNANAYEIYPIPQSVTYPADHSSFTMTDSVNVVAGSGVDSYTTGFLEEILTRFDRTMTTSDSVDAAKTNIVLAVHGSSDPLAPSAVSDLFTAETKYDPYLLKADNGTITIIGKDADSVYYGVATLQMMFTSFNAEKFLNVTIEDYSETQLRGVVEGFYGAGFGTDAIRATQIEGIRDVKGNMYVFAPKADPYHGSQWAALYPDDMLESLKGLVDTGKRNKVDFAWSVHIGLGGVLGAAGGTITDDLYAENLAKLKAKFNQLYGIGVRNFHILNDDYNSGTYARQVQLLNDINRWLKAKGDCGPLIYCCAGYNVGWASGGAGGNGAELAALAGVDKDVIFFWTGDLVNSPITPDNVNWASSRSQHKVATWLNYPCSEHAPKSLFLGNIHHYIKDACSGGLENQIGFFSNPIASPEANKVAYFQLLSWAWHRQGYTEHEDALWEDCFKYLQPEVYQAYLTIARNVSNCPDSGRVPSFPESEYIKEALEAVQAAALAGEDLYDNADAQALTAELEKIHAAIAAFRANCVNSTLKTELEPWLKSLADVVNASQKAIEAEKALSIGDTTGAWNAFSEGAVALGTWDTYPTSNYNSNYNGVKVKAGSLRIQPFASAMLNHVRDSMAEVFIPGGGLAGGAAPIVKMGGAVRDNDANAQKILDGNPATYAGYSTNQVQDDYFGVDLGSVKLVSCVDILQGQNDTHHDYFHKAVLEYSADGERWSVLAAKVNSHHIRVEGLNAAARYVRLRLLETGYGAKENYYTYIREFTVTEYEPDLLYTNIGGLSGVRAEADGGVYTLSAGSLTLDSGKYVGLRLPRLMGIQNIEGAPSGVELQHSVSGQVWTGGAPNRATLMGYIRLYNDSGSPVTLSNVSLTAREPVRTNLSYVSSNLNLYNGTWDMLTDGDRGSQLYTNAPQAAGQYIILDLGARQPVHDVILYFDETADCPHNLSISLGDTAAPNGDWREIRRFVDADKQIIVPNGAYSCDAAGAQARYIKLTVTDSHRQWMKLNELEVNKTVPQGDPITALSASSGDPASAVDNDLLTFFTPDANAAGHWEKLLQSPTTFDALTVLRGPGGATAQVKVQQDNTWKDIGVLSSSATTISMRDQGAVTGVRIEWTASDVPSIAEVLLAGGAVAGDAPVLYPNIYEKPADPNPVSVPNGTAEENLPLPDQAAVTTSGGVTAQVPVVWSCQSYDPLVAANYTFTGEFNLDDVLVTNPGCFTLTAQVTVRPAGGGSTQAQNLALNKTVYVSGVEVENGGQTPPSKAVDGDSGTRWSGNYMKGQGGAVNGSNPSWIVVDLGENVNSVTGISMEYYNLVWPATYKVQVAGNDYTPKDFSSNVGTVPPTHEAFTGQHAEDAGCWTTVKTFTEQAPGAHPTNNVTQTDLAGVTLPDQIRYVRLFFTKMNGGAGGHAIGLEELTVTGTRSAAPTSPNIASIAARSVAGVQGDAWDVLNVPSKVAATLADGASVLLPVTWDSTGYDPQSTAPQTFNGTLDLSGGVTNTGNVTPTLTVTLTAPPDVTGWSVSPSYVTAPYGTSFADLPLPENAVVQFSNGVARTLPVTWAESGYSANSLEVQAVTGKVTLPWSQREYSVTIQVCLDPIRATSITVTPETLTLHANESSTDHTGNLTAAVGGADASDKTVVWRSGDPHVAAVNDRGVVTAIGAGETTVYATTHDGSLLTDSCQVTVKWTLEGKVTVSGDHRIGSTLSADLNSFVQDAKKSIDIQWYRQGAGEAEFTPISEAAQKEYAVPASAENVGAQYKVVITGSGLYDGSSASVPVAMAKMAGLPLKAVPTYQNVSKAGAEDGAITGLFKGRAYEYKQVDNGTDDPGEDGWTLFLDDSDDETGLTGDFGTARIDGLGEGNYAVRRAADELHDAGPHRTVTIAVKGASLFDVNNPHTFEGGIVTMGRSQIPAGDTARITVTPDTGYELVPGSLKAVTDAGEEYTAEESQTANVYTFTMPEAAVTIQAEFRLKTYTIIHALEHITCTLGNENEHTATHGQKLSITLVPDAGYEMRPDTVTITNTDTGKAFTDYTYLPDETVPGSRTITFTNGVTCNLTISGQPVKKEYILDCRFDDLTSDAASKITHGEPLTIQITPAAGYALPAAKTDIHITMGGADFTDFTYQVRDTYAEIIIGTDVITGDLTVTAAAAIPLTSVSILGAARVGERLTAGVVPGGATVTCKWIITAGDGSAEYFAESALVIPASAEGKTIGLEVTGTGRYSGTLTAPSTAPILAALADKAALRAAYDDGLTVANEDYTTDSWDYFQSALASAEAVLRNGDATQDQVDSALAGLEEAREALEKQNTSPIPSKPSKPSSTTTTQVEEDGTKVTTVTHPDGAKTETSEFPDGTRAVVETKTDGSKTQTVERPNGMKSETVTAKGGDVTITVTDQSGETLVKAELPAVIPEPETKFEDVDSTPWAEEAIHKMVGLGLVNGTGGSKYSPAAPMTRGSLATILHRLSQGKTGYVSTFQDVAQGQYYTDGVAWAAKVGVVTGYSDQVFAPERTITREQLAVMMARYAKLVGLDTRADVNSLDTFTDGAATSDWAAEDVAWCVENGILKGKGSSNLDPISNVTRAEAAVMLDRFIALLK